MRKLFAAVLAFAVSLALASVLIFQGSPAATTSPTAMAVRSCSCGAPDDSCSVSLECQGGCEMNCGPDGDCWAYCSGFFGLLGTETNLEIQNGSYHKLVAELTRLSGKGIEFSPAKSVPAFNLGFKQSSLWDALEFLSDRGVVRIDGKDFESLRRLRKSLLSGDRISITVQNTPISVFVNDLAGLTGLSLRITAGRSMALVDVELQGATLNEILVKVSEQTGTKISEDSASPLSP